MESLEENPLAVKLLDNRQFMSLGTELKISKSQNKISTDLQTLNASLNYLREHLLL